ncbi:hypothetical protein ARMA_1267 [Ardenticatena maritima]|uniref:Uncharacterized protein n=1 Tax=Ardenticatena maritima TaxID=872965 RepID=A0A0M9UCE1_9CHLR|nr:hypothetical protein ARMA_1267 [Ardenticatena maritima]
MRGLGLFRHEEVATNWEKFLDVSIPLRGLGLFRRHHK